MLTREKELLPFSQLNCILILDMAKLKSKITLFRSVAKLANYGKNKFFGGNLFSEYFDIRS